MTKSINSPYKYKITLDINSDALNWYVTCNNYNISHGVDFSKRMSKDLYSKIAGKNEDEAYKFLIPFLKQKYIDDKEVIDNFTDLMNTAYKQWFTKACSKMVDLLNKPLYRNSFTTALTTAPRAPYRYEDGYTWVPIGWYDPIRIFLHELLHFQFIHYWRNNPDSAVSKLSNEQFEYLKESLTVILDEDIVPIILMPDKGYDMHKKFREKLHIFWKKNHDFNKLVDFGLKILPDFVS
jgi:hypothetical protein